MFDNLRELSESPLYEEEPNELYQEPEAAATPVAAPARKRKSRKFLGMTAQQRFLVSVMLLITVCLLGSMVMFVTGSMSVF